MKTASTITMIISAILLSGCGIQSVDQSHTGVKKTLGRVDQNPIGAGVQFYNPFTTDIIQMDNHEQKLSDSSNVFTKDVQKADVQWALNYILLPTASVSMYINMGEAWQDLLLPQIVNGAMKNSIGQWNAVELVSGRDKAAAAIEAAIAAELKPYGVAVKGFQLVDIQYDPTFDQAIRDKVIAIQHAEQAQNDTVKVTEVAKQTVITANAAAEAMKIKSEALSQNQNLVAYEAVQKWDGHNSQVSMGQGGGMMLNLSVGK